MTVSFYLAFPTETRARSAEDVARQQGLQVDVIPPKVNGGTWLCCIKQDMPQSWTNVRASRTHFRDLATALGGFVYRWRATSIVTPSPITAAGAVA